MFQDPIDGSHRPKRRRRGAVPPLNVGCWAFPLERRAKAARRHTLWPWLTSVARAKALASYYPALISGETQLLPVGVRTINGIAFQVAGEVAMMSMFSGRTGCRTSWFHETRASSALEAHFLDRHVRLATTHLRAVFAQGCLRSSRPATVRWPRPRREFQTLDRRTLRTVRSQGFR